MVSRTITDQQVQFSYITDAREGRLDLSLHGELDFACSELLERIGDDEDGDLTQVVIDIAALEFIDTAGVRALADVQSRNLMLGRTVQMVGATRLVERVVTLYGRRDLLVLA
jgi:anti-anti-sigma factor